MKFGITYGVCCCLLLLFLSACKKKQTYPHYLLAVNENMQRDYCYLPGSYWIYKDSVTGRMDSFEVAATTFDSSLMAGRGDVWVAENHMYIYGFNLDSPSSKPSIWEWEFRENRLYVYNLDFAVLFRFPEPFIKYPIEDNMQWNSLGNCVIISSPVFELNGLTYNNVIEVHRYIPGDSTHFDHWFYMNPSAGIIKMKLNTPGDTIILELQRYHMVK